MSFSRALRTAVAVALTAYVVWKADPATIVRVSAGADLRWIGGAIALVAVDRALNAYRWVVLLRALTPGSRPPIPDVMRIFFVSSFVGNFLPSIGGDVYRAYQLARLDVRPAQAAASVLMDRALGVLSMVLVAAMALTFLKRIDVPGVVPALLAAAAGCVVAAAAVFSERATALAVTIAGWLRSPRVSHIARGLTDAVRRYADHHGALVAVLSVSIWVQLLRVLQAYCLGRSLGIAEPLGLYVALIPLITLVMQIPITIAGLGTTQYAFERLFGYAGIAAPPAVALSILFLALGTVGNLPGGLLYVFGNREAVAGAPHGSSTVPGSSPNR
ncbi:MAG: lysylphosphatidylglycerol synthase transmembrane domain-containing protein [Vicinamibacterales bacterium]